MSDSIHDLGHPVAAGVPTLARSGGTTCAVERGPLVWTGEAIACEGDESRNVARAKPPPSARVHLGLVAANSKPRPVRAEARGLRSAAAGRMARRRRSERRRRSAQKNRGARPLLLHAPRRAATSTAARQRRAARRRWARSRLELLVKVSTKCRGRRRLQRGQRAHPSTSCIGGTSRANISDCATNYLTLDALDARGSNST